jgi:two-component sensor histidine kinase
MVDFAVATTSHHLATHREDILRRWRGSLHRSVAGYAAHAGMVGEWGEETVNLLVQMMRARGPVEKDASREAVFECARRVSARQLRAGFALEEILHSLTLLRSSVNTQVQTMLHRRLWVAFPPDVMLAAERVHEAIDLQILAIGQAYLEARDRVIRQSQHDLEQSNRQLRTLIQEMHHRIKNNLQTLADLLYLETLGASDPAQKSLRDSIGRVKSIAAVHQMLSADQIEEVDIRQMAELIGETIGRDLAGAGRDVTVEVVGDTLRLPSKQATSLALVLSELLTNALEHAFADARGHIVISVAASDGEVAVSVRDDGRGLPPGFCVESDAHLGLRIVGDLVSRDLRGTFALRSEGGAVAEVRFRKAGR